MYERRRKVPMLDVAERLMQAAGADLGMVTTVVWEVDFLPGLKAFWYPDRLWRVEVPGCFDTGTDARPGRPHRAGRVGSAGPGGSSALVREPAGRGRPAHDHALGRRSPAGGCLDRARAAGEDPGGLGARGPGGIDGPEPWRVRTTPENAQSTVRTRWARSQVGVQVGSATTCGGFASTAGWRPGPGAGRRLSRWRPSRRRRGSGLWLLSSWCGAVLMCFSLLVVW